MDRAFNLSNSHQSPQAAHLEQSGCTHCRHVRGNYMICCHCGDKQLRDRPHGKYITLEDADIPATPDPSTQ